MIPFDNRNPFAPWGHEEIKYSVDELEKPGFESSLIADSMKNEVAENAAFVIKTIIGENMPEAFGTNNDASVYPNVATNAYGMKKELQPKREPGENLEYYGIQADDLKKYGEKTEPEPPTPIEQPDDEIWYTSTDGNIVTPQAIDFGTGVTVVSNTYEDGKGVIKLSGNVTSIGKSAFANCTGLTSVIIPDSVTSIGISAFDTCTSLQSVTIPQGVTSIGADAFTECTSLQSIIIPQGVTSIGGGAFAACTSLQSVTIPQGVTTINGITFADCSSLQSVTIPQGVTSIGTSAFSGCTSLQSVTIPQGVISVGKAVFLDCTGLTSVVIPDSVTTIGNQAFDNCSGLTSVTIPNSVTSIGADAFKNVAHIEYHGTATGSPWGAQSIN